MDFIKNAFILVHIKISNKGFAKVSARHAVTVLLILFLIFNTIELYFSLFQFELFDFIESAVFIFLNVYIAFFWLKAWPTANKMLRRAGDYEDECVRKYKDKK